MMTIYWLMKRLKFIYKGVSVIFNINKWNHYKFNVTWTFFKYNYYICLYIIKWWIYNNMSLSKKKMVIQIMTIWIEYYWYYQHIL